VKIRWLTSIKEIVGPSLTVERMELDDKGRPHPTGEFDTLEADSVVLALGQQTDSTFLRDIPGVVAKPDGTVEIDRKMMTGHAGLFAGGDMVPSERRTVTVATGTASWRPGTSTPGWRRGVCRAGTAAGGRVPDAALAGVQRRRSRGAQRRLGDVERMSGFTEVLAGLDERAARMKRNGV